MKRIITSFCLIALYLVILSTIIYGQLPSDPFIAYDGNPVIPRGNVGQWDSRAVWWPNVTLVDDTFYITYNGTSDFNNSPVAIGLATSTDGYNFGKSSLNPIFSADGSGFDAYTVECGQLFYKNSMWHLYYSGRPLPPNQPGNIIGRAVSSAGPYGPWIRSDDTLLAVGSPGEWDSEVIDPQVILENGSELIMYYWATDIWPATLAKIGRATSTDSGLTWEKYNDPTTITPPYLESDPVLKPDKPYDMNNIWGCTVFKLDTIWEMYYAGFGSGEGSICYAKSLDGIVWLKDSINNPIFTASQDPIADNVFEKPGIVKTDSLYFMYYDYGISLNSNGIGLATADNVVSVVNSSSNLPSTYTLYQNYPNPFNPNTKIKYSVPQSSQVVIKVFNILGNKIETLVNEEKQTGTYEITWYAEGLPSGIYFYQLKTGGYVQTKKMILLK